MLSTGLQVSRLTTNRTEPPRLRPKSGPMTGLSLCFWHDGRLAPVEGGGAQAERGRAQILESGCFKEGNASGSGAHRPARTGLGILEQTGTRAGVRL